MLQALSTKITKILFFGFNAFSTMLLIATTRQSTNLNDKYSTTKYFNNYGTKWLYDKKHKDQNESSCIRNLHGFHTYNLLLTNPFNSPAAR